MIAAITMKKNNVSHYRWQEFMFFLTAGADRSSTATYDLTWHAIKILCLGVRICLGALGVESRE